MGALRSMLKVLSTYRVSGTNLLPVKIRDTGLGNMSNFLNKSAYDQRSKAKDRDVRLLSKSSRLKP